MTVEIVFEDNDNIYRIDFLKVAPKLGITPEDIKQLIYKEIQKT